jgi:hypothetical protein
MPALHLNVSIVNILMLTTVINALTGMLQLVEHVLLNVLNNNACNAVL